MTERERKTERGKKGQEREGGGREGNRGVYRKKEIEGQTDKRRQ